MPQDYIDSQNFLVNKPLWKKLKKIPDYIIKNTLYCVLFGEDASFTRIRAYQKEAKDNWYFRGSRSSKYEQILENKIDDILNICTQINKQIKTKKVRMTKNKKGQFKIQVPLDISEQLHTFPNYINLSAIVRRIGHIPKEINVRVIPTKNFPNWQTRESMMDFNKVLKRRLPKLQASIALLESIVNKK